jgi:hypothetical protein
VCSAAPAWAEGPWPSIRPGGSAAEAKILAALDDKTQLEFIETPLNQVLEFLQDMHEMSIAIDTRALDDVGVGIDVPITRSLKGISLHSALQLLLRDLDLTYIVEDEVLMITTLAEAQARPEVRFYDVAKLLGDDGNAAELVATLAALFYPLPPAGGSAAMTPGFGAPGGAAFGYEGQAGGYGMEGYGSGLAPGEMPGAAGPRRPRPAVPQIIPYKHLLIVRAPTTQHREVSRLLGAMAAAMGTEAD